MSGYGRVFYEKREFLRVSSIYMAGVQGQSAHRSRTVCGRDFCGFGILFV